MSNVSHDRTPRHRSESKTGEISFARPLEMARAVLPLLDKDSELADMSFVDTEDTLAKLNSEAESAIVERGRVPRKVKRKLSRCAHRLLEITAEEPDLHEARTFDLIGHAADATGERKLLEITLEQARIADRSYDTSENLQAIEGALELDMPFSDVMKTLNQKINARFDNDDEPHQPLDENYDYLFDANASGAINRKVQQFNESGEPIEKSNALFRE